MLIIKSIYKVEGVPYPENAREKDDAMTSYFELVPAEAFFREGLYILYTADFSYHILAIICTPIFIFQTFLSALATVTPKMFVVYA